VSSRRLHVEAPKARSVVALVVASIAVSVALPGELTPWAATIRAAFRADWPAVTVVLSLLLALAGRLLPAPRAPLALVDHSGLTVGLLLMLEPLLHLAVLGVCTRFANPVGAEALLPTTWNPPMASAGFATRLLVFTAITPVCEEFFFRGRLLPWLRGHVGAVSAVSISALAFAAAHGDLVQVAIALPVGVLLGVMRLAGADLGACMLAHAVHNGLFIMAGPALVGLPIAAPLLAAGGMMLAVFAWFYHVRPRPGQFRHALLAAGCGVALITITAPWYRQLMDHWWTAGVHRLCVYWRISNEQLFARLLIQERNHRLTDQRRVTLVMALKTTACQTTPRQTGVLALLEPTIAPTGPTWEDDAAVLFDELANGAPITAMNGELARRLGLSFPTAFADAVLEYPEALSRWLPLPERSSDAAVQLQYTVDARDRRILLRAWERMFPGHVAGVIQRLPAVAVTPIDRAHMRLHYGEE